MSIIRIFIFLCLFLLFPTQKPVSAAGPFGMGLIIGYPNGISFKNWIGNRNSFEGIVGLGFGKGSLTLGLDWSHHWSELTPVQSGRLYLGLGGGALLGVGNSYFGVRGKGFIDYTFVEVPINLFVEVAPTLLFFNDGVMVVTGGIGCRWFF